MKKSQIACLAMILTAVLAAITLLGDTPSNAPAAKEKVGDYEVHRQLSLRAQWSRIPTTAPSVPNAGIRDLVFDPGGKLLAISALHTTDGSDQRDGLVAVYNWSEDKLTYLIKRKTVCDVRLIFSMDGKYLATKGDNISTVWDIQKQQTVLLLDCRGGGKPYRHDQVFVQFSNEPNQYLVGYVVELEKDPSEIKPGEKFLRDPDPDWFRANVRIGWYDASQHRFRAIWQEENVRTRDYLWWRPILSLAKSPDDKFLVFCTAYCPTVQSFHLLSAKDGKHLKSLGYGRAAISSNEVLGYSHYLQAFVLKEPHNSIIALKPNGEVSELLKLDDNIRITWISLDTEGRLLSLCTGDLADPIGGAKEKRRPNEVLVYELETGQVIFRVRSSAKVRWVRSAVAAKGELIACADEQGTIKLYKRVRKN